MGLIGTNAFLSWFIGDGPACIRFADEGIQKAKERGLAFWSYLLPLAGIHGALSLNKIELAEGYDAALDFGVRKDGQDGLFEAG